MSAFDTVAVDEKPGGGSIFVGIAAQSFATGPTLILLLVVYSIVFDDGTFGSPNLRNIPSIVFFSSLFCLIGSVPAACINAAILSQAAKHGRDALWLSAASGGLIGLAVALIFGWRLQPYGIAWFASVGTLMGLLHWLIAIRPRRRWRHRMMRDAESIRAME